MQNIRHLSVVERQGQPARRARPSKPVISAGRARVVLRNLDRTMRVALWRETARALSLRALS
jgi:hypothetical protein